MSRPPSPSLPYFTAANPNELALPMKTVFDAKQSVSPKSTPAYARLKTLATFGIPLALWACGGGGGGSGSRTPPAAATPALQHILFVGDSFTHGRYTPVRTYHAGGTQNATTGSALVVDENQGQTGTREEKLETGPFGGIPAVFAQLAVEAGLNYDVHIEAISETSLKENYAAASGVIDQSKWNAVVLQELSAKPLPKTLLTSDLQKDSNPSGFCSSVQTIEQGVHGAAPSANVYLYETWPRADLAQQLTADSYTDNLRNLGNANHNAYYGAARYDGAIAAVAPAGEAWQRAWAEGIANPDPSAAGTSTLPLLWYNINAVNDPAISSPDLLHPSIYGAYLSGLVLFEQITGTDVRTFGATEIAAQQLGIPATTAVQLQQVAWETVTQENAAPIDQTADPCMSKKE